MKRMLRLLPFALFLIILPFPGTMTARLLLLAVCFGITLWQWWRMPDVRAAIPCRPALLIWAAVCVASLVYSVDFAYTASELKNELGYTMMAFFAFFVLAADRAAAIWLFRAVGASLALIGSWATLAWVSNNFAWDDSGHYGGIGIFATYLVTIVPVLAWLVFEDPLAVMRRVAVGLLGFAVFLAVICMQRAAWPALAAQALLILGHAFRRRHLAIDRRVMAGAAVAVVLIATAGMQYTQHARFDRPGAEGHLTDNVRVTFWPSVVAKIAEHPLVGAGFGRQTMHMAYPELTPADVTDLWHAHNVLLNYGLQLGVPGMIAFLTLLSAFAWLFWQAAAQGSGWAGIAGLALIAGVLLRNQFNDFFIRDMSLLFWALLGIFARLAMSSPSERDDDAAP